MQNSYGGANDDPRYFQIETQKYSSITGSYEAVSKVRFYGDKSSPIALDENNTSNIGGAYNTRANATLSKYNIWMDEYTGKIEVWSTDDNDITQSTFSDSFYKIAYTGNLNTASPDDSNSYIYLPNKCSDLQVYVSGNVHYYSRVNVCLNGTMHVYKGNFITGKFIGMCSSWAESHILGGSKYSGISCVNVKDYFGNMHTMVAFTPSSQDNGASTILHSNWGR